jgi:GT2 family glycosyltransferase
LRFSFSRRKKELMTKKSSIIICTKDRSDDLKNFINSLHQQTFLPQELIVIDASKKNHTNILLSKYFDDRLYELKYIQASPGLTRQRNIGIQNSQGQYVFFFDDDVVLDKRYIETIIATFERFEDYNVGGICGRITNVKMDKNFIDLIFKKLFLLSEYGKGKIKFSGFPAHRNDERLSFVEVLSGCCMAFDRKIFSKFMFDEKLTGYSYMEDVDFTYRVSREFNLIFQPEAKLKHYPSTFKTSDTKQLRKMLAQNHLYLFKKNISKTLPHITAFGLSLAGLILYNFLVLRDFKACKGILKSLRIPIK